MEQRITKRTHKGAVCYYPQAKVGKLWSDWLRLEALGKRSTRKTTISFVLESGARSFIDAHKED